MIIKVDVFGPSMIFLNGEPTGILLPSSQQPMSSDGYSGYYFVKFVPGKDYTATFRFFNKVIVYSRYNRKPIGQMSYLEWVSMNLAPHTRLYPFGKPQTFNMTFTRLMRS